MAYPARRLEDRFTYGDYLRWPSEERWELIDGVAYDMTPTPSVFHQRLSRRLLYEIEAFLKDKTCEVFAAPFDVRLPEVQENDEEVCTVVQPDLLVVCDPAKIDEKGCRGAPDFVIEIISPSTAQKDQIRKVELYEKHGVKEFWLVHPMDRIVVLRSLGEDGKYGMPRFAAASGRIAVGVLPGLEIDMDAVFAPPPSAREA